MVEALVYLPQRPSLWTVTLQQGQSFSVPPTLAACPDDNITQMLSLTANNLKRLAVESVFRVQAKIKDLRQT